MQKVKQNIYIMIMEWRVFVTCLAPHYKLRHHWMLNLLSVYIWSMWLVTVLRFKERERKRLRSQEFEGSPSKSVLHATLWHNGIAMDISLLFNVATKKRRWKEKQMNKSYKLLVWRKKWLVVDTCFVPCPRLNTKYKIILIHPKLRTVQLNHAMSFGNIESFYPT